MDDALSRWVAALRGSAQAAEDALAAEVRELRTRLAGTDEAERDTTLIDEIATLTAVNADLEAQVREADALRGAARRARVEALLAVCAARIEEASAAEDAVALAGAEALYGDVRSRSTVDLRRLLAADARLPTARERLVAWLRRQDALLAERNVVSAEATRLSALRDRLVAEEAALEARLVRSHDVHLEVIRALLALEPEQARRYVDDTLAPRRTDAQVEMAWGLPADVLAEVQDGS